MITEHDLQEAIAECQGVRNPDAKTCMMLAAFLTIKKEMFPEKVNESDDLVNDLVKDGSYSYAIAPSEQVETTIEYESDTEFAQAVHGKNAWEIWAIVDEAMDALQVLNPPLYKSIMRKIEY